jgi:hypothetical protein
MAVGNTYLIVFDVVLLVGEQGQKMGESGVKVGRLSGDAISLRLEATSLAIMCSTNDLCERSKGVRSFPHHTEQVTRFIFLKVR